MPPEVEALVQGQLTSGKYQNALEVILAGIKLLEQQEDIYQGQLQDLQQEARIGWEASRRGEVVDGSIAMAQIRANVRSLPPQASRALRCFRRSMTSEGDREMGRCSDAKKN
ncbi:ribbon-helix-helix domain-containing protein [Nostoc sp. DSM 114161]|uniref:ribbon-helix-helix domain-containing protein n=1 Tax=Nostoc sp. DSM 114161 TaxID=3440143 RepID=UPI00404586BD